MKKLLFALSGALLLASLAVARPARADEEAAAPASTSSSTNFAVNLQAGLAKRFFTSPAGAGGVSGSFGPLLLAEGEVALAPLIHFGLYLDEEIAADGEPRAPFITSVGGRFIVKPPLPSNKFSFWVFVGFGFAGLYAPGYHQSLPFENFSNPQSNGGTLNADATVPSTTGSFFEIPFGAGMSYRLRRPWTFVAEVSGRAAVDVSGEYFDPSGRNAFETAPPNTPTGVEIGSESIGIFVTAGVGLDL